MINFHRQINTFCLEGEKSFFFTTHEQLYVRYSGVSAIRASTKLTLWKRLWRKRYNRFMVRNWLSWTFHSFFLRELFLCLYDTFLSCWWKLRSYSGNMYLLFLPSTFSFIQCHSVACIGCVNKFEVERKNTWNIFVVAFYIVLKMFDCLILIFLFIYWYIGILLRTYKRTKGKSWIIKTF